MILKMNQADDYFCLSLDIVDLELRYDLQIYF